MKQIVVMSGKGGTGKTTITAALASCADTPVVVADCDVDAANLHLLLRPEVEAEQRFMAGSLPAFDSRGCSLCGICMSACVYHAISLKHGQYQVDIAACEGCGVCAHICPDHLISMTPRMTGYTLEGRSRFNQPMVHAHLCIGQENSGKLVTRVRQIAVETARAEGIETILIDGPPGLGCPAIAAMSGADMLLLIAEAGAAGAHDVARLLDLRARFGMPAACVINKADLDDISRTDIRERCAREAIPVLAEFPWSPLFPESLRQGRTLTEIGDEGLLHILNGMWSILQNNGATS
jgi:MinD superfamily P-loop ATPase